MSNPTPEEIVGQTHAEEHQSKLARLLVEASNEAARMAFNVKYNRAQLSKSELHALRVQATELLAIIDNEEAKAVRS